MHIIDTLHQHTQRPLGKALVYSCPVALLLLWFTILYAQSQPLWQTEQQSAMLPAAVQQGQQSKNLLQLSHEVAERHLFGRSPQANAPTQLASHIRVLGIFLAADPKKSSAVMSVSDAPEANYWPGDALPGGGTLREIRVDRVIVEQDGQLQSALFEMDSFPTSLDNPNADKSGNDQEAPDEASSSDNGDSNNNDAANIEVNQNFSNSIVNDNSEAEPAAAGTDGRPAFPLREWRRFLQRDRGK